MKFSSFGIKLCSSVHIEISFLAQNVAFHTFIIFVVKTAGNYRNAGFGEVNIFNKV